MAHIFSLTKSVQGSCNPRPLTKPLNPKLISKKRSCIVDDINPALPIIRNIPDFPSFRVLYNVMQDFYINRMTSPGQKATFGLKLKGSMVSGLEDTPNPKPYRVLGLGIRVIGFWD